MTCAMLSCLDNLQLGMCICISALWLCFLDKTNILLKNLYKSINVFIYAYIMFIYALVYKIAKEKKGKSQFLY